MQLGQNNRSRCLVAGASARGLVAPRSGSGMRGASWVSERVGDARD